MMLDAGKGETQVFFYLVKQYIFLENVIGKRTRSCWNSFK